MSKGKTKKEIKDVEIFEQPLYNNEGDVIGKLAIFQGGYTSITPNQIMESVVEEYTKDIGRHYYDENVEIKMDNPWLRVIIYGRGSLCFEQFNNHNILNGFENNEKQ